jgi:hypothetical protein
VSESRIGRKQTPEERYYQRVSEEPDFLRELAQNLWSSERYGNFPGDKWVTGDRIQAEWDALDEAERASWDTRVLRMARANLHPAPPPVSALRLVNPSAPVEEAP